MEGSSWPAVTLHGTISIFISWEVFHRRISCIAKPVITITTHCLPSISICWMIIRKRFLAYPVFWKFQSPVSDKLNLPAILSSTTFTCSIRVCYFPFLSVESYHVLDFFVESRCTDLAFDIFQASKSESDMRDIAARICRDYLTGAWKTIPAEDLQLKRISGGLSNFLYYVRLPDQQNGSSPKSSNHCYKRARKDSYSNMLEPKEVSSLCVRIQSIFGFDRLFMYMLTWGGVLLSDDKVFCWRLSLSLWYT